jgi:hypothetical protein
MGGFKMAIDERRASAALRRASNGERITAESIEAERMAEAIQETLLPKEMDPGRSEWEALGFVFEEIPDDELMYRAKLPKGWKMVSTDHPMATDIIDEQGRKRGSMFYKASLYDRKASMYLCRRYKVSSDYKVDGYDATYIVYFGNEQERLFVAGEITYSYQSPMEEQAKAVEQIDKLKAVAAAWGKEHYPDYENIYAYWDIDQEKKNVPGM